MLLINKTTFLSKIFSISNNSLQAADNTFEGHIDCKFKTSAVSQHRWQLRLYITHLQHRAVMSAMCVVGDLGVTSDDVVRRRAHLKMARLQRCQKMVWRHLPSGQSELPQWSRTTCVVGDDGSLDGGQRMMKYHLHLHHHHHHQRCSWMVLALVLVTHTQLSSHWILLKITNTVSCKNVHLILANFKHSFTATICQKFAIKHLTNSANYKSY